MMKKLLLILCCISPLFILAQTREHPNRIAAGGGFQWYNGDLGNSFFNLKKEWYGFSSLQYSRYLSRSFNVQAYATMGETGRCSDFIPDPEHPILMLRSRTGAVGLQAQYKFANGYLLRQTARVAPFVILGAALHNHEDVWTTSHPRVNEGNYLSFNTGAGLSWHFLPRFSLGYTLRWVYFATDKLDFIEKGANDQLMQHEFLLGYEF